MPTPEEGESCATMATKRVEHGFARWDERKAAVICLCGERFLMDDAFNAHLREAWRQDPAGVSGIPET